VIKKLGLEVTWMVKYCTKANKLIMYFDGNEFFGNKHQMATQNINEMIEGIDLLTNYSGFALADGGYKGIALNLHTKTAIKISGFLMSNWVMESIMPSVF
jgi:hypothetical protein